MLMFYLAIETKYYVTVTLGWHDSTVLSAKSDNDLVFCLQSYQRLIIDRSLVIYSICMHNQSSM